MPRSSGWRCSARNASSIAEGCVANSDSSRTSSSSSTRANCASIGTDALASGTSRACRFCSSTVFTWRTSLAAR
jgi:hypothetical protein